LKQSKNYIKPKKKDTHLIFYKLENIGRILPDLYTGVLQAV